MSIFDFLKKKNTSDSLSQIGGGINILPHEIYEANTLDLKDIIAPSALKISPKELNLGEKIVRSFFVISYPRYLGESWFAPIINLDRVFDVSIFIQKTDRIHF